jgi:hypothetical protein
MVSDFCRVVVLKVSNSCQILVQISHLRFLLCPSRLIKSDEAGAVSPAGIKGNSHQEKSKWKRSR